jgi:hypothetical protein
MPRNDLIEGLGLDQYKYDFVNENAPVFRTEKGLNEGIVREISAIKEEPEWMLAFRLKALDIYYSKPMPTWGGDLSDLDRVLDDITYYIRPQDRMEHSWDDVPGGHQADLREAWGSPRRSRRSWPAWAPSTSRRWSTTP